MATVSTTNEETKEKMTFYTNKKGRRVDLPLRESPIRFAVLRRNGLSSNAWGRICRKVRRHIRRLPGPHERSED